MLSLQIQSETISQKFINSLKELVLSVDPLAKIDIEEDYNKKVNITEDKYYSPVKYTSLKELRNDYAQRIDDIKSGKEELTPFDEGLDDLMVEIESELKNENLKV